MQRPKQTNYISNPQGCGRLAPGVATVVEVIHGGALVAAEGPCHGAQRGRRRVGRVATAAQHRCRHRRRKAMAEEGLVHGREQQGGAGGRRQRGKLRRPEEKDEGIGRGVQRMQRGKGEAAGGGRHDGGRWHGPAACWWWGATAATSRRRPPLERRCSRHGSANDIDERGGRRRR